MLHLMSGFVTVDILTFFPSENEYKPNKHKKMLLFPALVVEGYLMSKVAITNNV